MARTFSLARLMVGVTALCVLCGWAVSSPRTALLAAFFIPTLVVWLVSARLSKHRVATAVLTIVGALAGFFVLAPIGMDIMEYAYELTLSNTDELSDLEPLAFALGAAVGAAATNGAFILHELLNPAGTIANVD